VALAPNIRLVAQDGTSGRRRDEPDVSAVGNPMSARLLLYALKRAYPTWRASGTSTEAYRVEQLEAWHVHCRWGLGDAHRAGGRGGRPPSLRNVR
jgi:hypothetical protein